MGGSEGRKGYRLRKWWRVGWRGGGGAGAEVRISNHQSSDT